MIEVETPQEIEVISNGIDVEARSLDVEVVDLKELDVTVAKREFVITGDDIYVPKLYEDAPQWMKDLVQLVVNSAVDTGNASTLAQLASMLSQFATSYVPLNQYTQNILDLSNADANIHTVIETLNSNYNNGLSQANAQIISLQNTKASKDEVVTQVVNTLAAQLTTPDSDIGAVISNINQAIANEATTRANSFNVLNTSLGNVGENVAGNSTAISGLQSSVTNINGTLSAQAGQITTLSNNLQSGSGTWATADTAVTNTLNSTITNGLATVESKWAYNSSLTINGTSYNSGFGLSNSAGTGVGSEFWINADKLKFTNNGKTGSKAPFTIDANGPTPQVTFNGIVSFSNVTGYTPPDVSGSISNNNDVFAQKLGYANYATMVNAAASGQTVVNGGYINTSLVQSNSINANQINTFGLIAENISANEIVGKTFTGSVINGAAINGAVIKASYLDLDGELEVLTNYHITVEMYNANPSLYIDAVYLSGTNEYRIPSLSTIKESDRNINLTSINQTITSLVKAYNNSNSGHNNKCVKIRPTLNYNGVVLSLSLNYSKPVLDWGPYITDSYEVSLYCFEQLVGTFKIRHNELMYDNGSQVINDSSSTLYVNGAASNVGFTNNVYGMQFSITRDTSTIDTYNVVMTASNQLLTANYTGGDILRAVVVGLPKNVSYTPANNRIVSNAVFKTYASMTINNMI